MSLLLPDSGLLYLLFNFVQLLLRGGFRLLACFDDNLVIVITR